MAVMAATKTQRVPPSDGLRGEISVPGDKSISHRAVILGSIASGRSEITGFLEGEDNLRTVEAFRAMGVRIEAPARGRLVINGVGLTGLKPPGGTIYAGNSGTTARLLCGLLSGQTFIATIDGDASLRARPMKRVTGPLREMGAVISGKDEGAYLPLTIKGSKLHGINHTSIIASAQVKSAILLAGLYADGETTVTEQSLSPSRNHTEIMLRGLGAPIDIKSKGLRVTIKKTEALRPFGAIEIPGDISSAAFFMVGALVTPGSGLCIKGVGINPTRTGIIDILTRMGADIELVNRKDDLAEPMADITVKSSGLRGVKISGEELLRAIDEFPVICVAAACARGTTVIGGASELRVKESDRISAMARALAAAGVKAEERPDGIVIHGGGGVRGGTIESLGDHRVAMAMAIAGLASTGGIEIKDAACVDVSFPGFFSLLEGVRAG